ncbi:MAG: alpha/beta hydrolase family protein [Chloroflexota bacterium]|nr:alpha/beta fold hydrolase [Chloroflexota bacterium]MBI5702865.1 alpha/beta fold hydrolase [Chloroflexota bacterium]
MDKTKLYFRATLLLALFLSACGTSAASPSAPTADPPPTAFASSLPLPTDTAAPTSTPLPTPTPTPHPLEIEAMRARSYPGSDIVIERELDPGVNYRRYYVSYLSEGLKIYALMTVPNGEKPPSGWPVIVFNHGYIPPQVYRTTERYVAYVDLIARSGYIVFRSDYRGHDQSEGQARGAYSNPDYTIDVLNAVASVKRYPDADPNRIGMWGHSMGGYITLRSMVISPDIKAGVIWAGVVASYPDLLYNWRRGPAASPDSMPRPGSWRTTFVQQYGSPETNPEFWNAISANSYLSEISGPIQLHHGTADTDVPVAFSETLFYQMLAAGQYVELYTYEGDNHNISNSFSTAMQRTIEFFDRYVK